MFTPSNTVAALGGIATRQQLIASGFSGYDLTRAVRSGRLIRVRQARYAVADASPDALAATRVGGLLAGTSAADSYGLWSGMDRRLHISVGTNSARLRTNVAPSFLAPRRSLTPDTSRRRVVIHWLIGGAVPELGPECWRVPLSTCLRQVVEWSDRETAIACLDTALRLTTLSPLDIDELFSDASAAERLIAAECRYGCDSGTESLVAQRFRGLGIAYRQQVMIPDVGRVDFGIRGTKIIIEVDGKRYHDDPAAYERDRWRDAELVKRGYTVIRLSYLRVTTDWAWCAGIVLATIAEQA